MLENVPPVTKMWWVHDRFSPYFGQMLCTQEVLRSQQLQSCALENDTIKIRGIMDKIRLGTGNENYYSVNLIHSKPNTKNSSHIYCIHNKQ